MKEIITEDFVYEVPLIRFKSTKKPKSKKRENDDLEKSRISILNISDNSSTQTLTQKKDGIESF